MQVQHPPPPQLLASLPSTLTQLFLADFRFPPDLPTMTRLSCLQKLELYNTRFEPGSMSMLNGTGQLQEFTMEYFDVPGDLEDDLDEEEWSLLTAALLSAVGQMQGLKRLSVTRGGLLCKDLPAHSFTALTAASELECLEWELAGALPRGALQHMFPEGKQLPHLHTLSLAEHWATHRRARSLTAADLSSIIAACPALERSSITCALRPGEQHGLLMLPARCTHLSIGDIGDIDDIDNIDGMAMDDSTVSVVAQLTQLRSLTWQHCPELTDTGLEQLTALRALTSLCLGPKTGLGKEVVQAALKFCEDLMKDSTSDCLLIQQVSKMVPGAVCGALSSCTAVAALSVMYC